MTRLRIVQILPESPLNEYIYCIQSYKEPFTYGVKPKHFWQEYKIVTEPGKWEAVYGEVFKDIGVHAYKMNSNYKVWGAVFKTLEDAEVGLVRLQEFHKNIAENRAFVNKVIKEIYIND